MSAHRLPLHPLHGGLALWLNSVSLTYYLFPPQSWLTTCPSHFASQYKQADNILDILSNISSRERDSRVRRTLFWLNWLSSYGNSAAAENFKLKIFFLMWIGIMWLGWVSTSHIHVDFYLKKSPTSTEINDAVNSSWHRSRNHDAYFHHFSEPV